jgi:hypothetical protein
MDFKKIRKILGWCALLNYVLLFIVAALFAALHEWLIEFNQLFFPVSVESYNSVLLMALAVWEVLIWVFTIIPYLALRIVYKG